MHPDVRVWTNGVVKEVPHFPPNELSWENVATCGNMWQHVRTQIKTNYGKV